ncbi:RNA polymerase sigma factor [Planomicrobium okeanokoites]|uniref:RNA polymerase sigma factor n=1 Tax=Planomicrobium okeanokoites TaxID=244 RepID=UPI00248F6A25|nr:sigma factor-like helix-turn-helix DNA-binding protein [Planomicrobium okeanokoites]
MQTDDLLNRAKAGDKEALIAWSRSFAPAIAQFAYQAGIAEENMSYFRLQVLKDFSNNIKAIEANNADNKIYESAFRILKDEQLAQTERSNELALKFEEDKETHKAIQEISLIEKLALILFQFHGKDYHDVAEILGLSESSADSAISEAQTELKKSLIIESDGDVQKRLDLLAKSYSRVQFTEMDEIIPEEVIVAEELPAEVKREEKTSVNKKTLATLAGISLFLSTVIGASFLFNEQPAETQQSAAEEENPTTVTKAMVQKWEAEYEEIRTAAPESLGLSMETFEQLEYVKKADALKERTFSRQNVKQLQDDPERMQEQVDVLMWNIHTPKGMLDSVENYRILSSETSKFLVIYMEKTEQLMTIADGLLEKYKDELATAEVNGLLSPEKLMHSRQDYPEEIENLTSSLSEYTFQYSVHPNEERFRTMRDITRFYQVHPFGSDMISSQYLEILWSTPVFDETGMLWPVELLPQTIVTMSAFMSDPLADPVLKGEVEPQLLTAFFTLLKGDEHIEVFDDKGVVKEEFQIAWESLLQYNSNPITFLMLPILEEFEESGWRESAHYDQLAYPDILYAIDLENSGELAAKLPNGDLQIETISFDLEDYDYSDIQPLYEEFSATYDLQLLSGVEPMDIIKLYHYANKIEDIETMWHLTADDELKPSLEEYTQKWREQPEITETMRNIEIFSDNLHRQGRKIYITAFGQPVEAGIEYQMGANYFTLITERDKIWLMQHQINEHYTKKENFEGYDANVQNYYKNIAESGNRDAIQLATPAEIAGIFLLALENEDVKTMRLLVNEMDDTISDDMFKQRWMNGHLIAYSKMTGISFTADAINAGSNRIHGGVDISMKSDSMDDRRYLQMEKVEDSWMILDMFGY